MHERTLLYGALGATALAAAFGVYKARTDATPRIEITPVSTIDATRSVSSAEIPIRLTSSDGTGLRMASLRANAVVEDPLAFTELHLVFENPEDRVLEGTFRITLPQGASLSRFAMKVGDAWQEGEVVEKAAARRAYEDFLHRRQDPALMEQGAGNEFSARVFPIPARGTKEIIVAYSEVMEAGAPYVLPLRGLPMLGALDVDVHAAGARAAAGGGRTNAVFGIHQQRITPGQDFVVDGNKLPRSAGLRSGDLAIVRAVPYASSRPDPVKSAIVLVDTSASRALGLGDQAALVQKTLARLPRDAKVAVACFDQVVAPIFEGSAGAFGEAEAKAIVARGALGASDVERALAWAGEQAKKLGSKRVVLVGDGVATAGETDAQQLKVKVEALRSAGVERIDAVAVGGIRDDAFLRTVVRGVLDKDGVVLDGKLGPEALARRLGEATSSGVPVKVEGASWSWPEKLDGLQAGDEVLVYAKIDPASPVRVAVGGQEFAPDLRTVERPLVERAWAQAKIQSLLDAPVGDAASTKQEIIALSTRHRVLSPHTAMLVLETEWDYRRFGIDRNATVDILTVRDGSVAVMASPRGWEKNQVDLRTERKGGGTPAPSATASPAAPAAAQAAREDDADEEARGEAPAGNIAAEPPTPAPSVADAPGDGLLEAPSATALGVTGTGVGGGGTRARGEEGQMGAGQGFGGIAPSGGARPRAEPPPPAPALRAPPGPAPTMGAPGPALRRPATPPADPFAGGEDRPARGIVRAGAIAVESGIAREEVQRVTRGALSQMRACYTSVLAQTPGLHGRVEVRVVIDPLGEVRTVTSQGSPPSAALEACATRTFKTLRFPAPGSSDARFTATFDFVDLQGGPDQGLAEQGERPKSVPEALPYEGRFKVVMEKLAHGERESALAEANQWHAEEPGDIMALVALGEALEAKGDVRTAARAYGSIVDLFSFRADSRRFAGERLERLSDPLALELAADTYGKAAEQRPDHPASHRLYAFTLLKAGRYDKAFEAMKRGATRAYPAGRFRGADRILREDLGLIAAAWTRAEPARAGEIREKLTTAGGVAETGPSLRFVLVWETDANDVDFHIHDGKGGHAYYAQRQLPSGGELYADVTTGYGPECFTIRGARAQRAYPYTLQAHYYSRGPMGYGMGKLQIVDHDGNGNLTFEERPFVVMIDRAYVDLGKVDMP